ncbi:MAG: tripartite tricarboxylate transporter TctB family protein [Proteobacteria bacterium]|nr:tripartite tricarboxylate transporter TctB family protein [Pseudomonadota bacterium]
MTVAKNDLMVGVVLIALAILYWLGADHIPNSILEGSIGADALPKMLGVALGILSLVLVLESFLAARAASAEGSHESPREGGWRTHRYALGMLCIGIGYVALVESIGYICAIAYLLAAVTLLAGGASRKVVIGFAVIGAIFFWALFVYVLEIRQPKGFWPDLWMSFRSTPAQSQSLLQLPSPHSAS